MGAVITISRKHKPELRVSFILLRPLNSGSSAHQIQIPHCKNAFLSRITWKPKSQLYYHFKTHCSCENRGTSSPVRNTFLETKSVGIFPLNCSVKLEGTPSCAGTEFLHRILCSIQPNTAQLFPNSGFPPKYF